MERQLFTIYGATGQQGGALIRYLLKHPRFSKIYKLRGITRDSSKPRAQALAQQGVVMVEADMNDPDSLKRATQGSHIVFAMTDFWLSGSREIETQQGKAQADAAVQAGAQAIIWSSLPRIGLPNFDSKADVEEYIRSLSIKAAFYRPGWFMQNHLTFSKPVEEEERGGGGQGDRGRCEAHTLVPLVDNEDIGKYLQPFLDDVEEKYDGVGLTACSAFVTPVHMCEVWSRVTGKVVKFEKEGGDGGGVTGGGGARGGDGDSWYYGEGSRKAMEWTLAQMEEKTTSWEEFVERVEGEEAWFR
ncbi:NAD(P)-binding protein [Periconia macrospinosa]|uniref:NAD(P)-binding protein n=1 Tax=Periconia macrospinosa TaxID=97972 RepID=A0A2V1DQR5_9PLEO|nr:NAD(P)-binding protein [Periconia macrospinosa]